MIKEKKGVAIGYSGDLPKIIASARGPLLEKLLEIAKTYNITVYRDGDLAETLYAFPIGSDIPEDLFVAVSEVLAYCYRVNSEFRKKIMGMETDNA